VRQSSAPNFRVRMIIIAAGLPPISRPAAESNRRMPHTNETFSKWLPQKAIIWRPSYLVASGARRGLEPA